MSDSENPVPVTPELVAAVAAALAQQARPEAESGGFRMEPMEEVESYDANADLVQVRVLVPLSYDGDPGVDGAEFYAPKGWSPPELRNGDGSLAPYLDGDGNEVVVCGDCFTTTRVQAEALIKARAVKIVD